MCPFRHIVAAHAEAVPRSVCKFQAGGACLRDGCRFFHGTQEQLAALLASGATTYRPADFGKVLDAEDPASLDK